MGFDFGEGAGVADRHIAKWLIRSGAETVVVEAEIGADGVETGAEVAGEDIVVIIALDQTLARAVAQPVRARADLDAIHLAVPA